ncbi:E2F/DP family [Hirschfeldia incana]|nr:E2F/DP family [Hirschfeldia incana]
MEMDLFVTPEKQRNHPSSVSLGKTPVRRKFIVDDDSEVVSEKKCQSRTSGGGLRQFSVMVCQKLEAKKITTYKEVADEIISDFATIKQNAEKPLNDNEYNEKNIRRRVYDALNVFMALDIIATDKKESGGKGFPLPMNRNKIMNSVQKKAAFLKELREKVSSLENLMSRNKEMVVKTEGFTLPFILLETNPHALVEIEISEDMQLVHLDFNSTPFSVHDDAYILKLMQEHKLQQQNRVSSPSSTHQHSSAHSSSSSCISSGTSGPVSWNSGIH